jgi:hypothetical protein
MRSAGPTRSVRFAQLKRDFKARRVSIGALLVDPPPYLETAKVFDMVLALPQGREREGHQDFPQLPGLAQQDVRRPERAPARGPRRALGQVAVI